MSYDDQDEMKKILTQTYTDPTFAEPIDRFNALEYFSRAQQFYKPRNVNVDIQNRMKLFPPLPIPSSNYPYFCMEDMSDCSESVKEKFGIDEGPIYDVEQCKGDQLFVVKLYNREVKGEEMKLMSIYYISQRVIYQIPDLFTLTEARLLAITCYLQRALNVAQKYRRFHPTTGYSWTDKTFEEEEAEEEEKKKNAVTDLHDNNSSSNNNSVDEARKKRKATSFVQQKPQMAVETEDLYLQQVRSGNDSAFNLLEKNIHAYLSKRTKLNEENKEGQEGQEAVTSEEGTDSTTKKSAESTTSSTSK